MNIKNSFKTMTYTNHPMFVRLCIYFPIRLRIIHSISSNTPLHRSLTTQQPINPSDQVRDAALRVSQVSIASGFNRRYGETPSPISLNVAEGGAAVREYLCNTVTATSTADNAQRAHRHLPVLTSWHQ